ncbi:MAG TPA: hypothetical protein VJM31_18200 [Vicinamibacterales bacterium]|nr:hypothetical protein [Vicinamibacterales bacterium]
MRRTGIDLSASRCILVDAETSGRRRQGEAGSLRLHHFASLSTAEGTDALTAELKALIDQKLFPRRAWVNLWDVRSSHKYLLLPSGPVSELESMARHHGADALGLEDAEVTLAATIGSKRTEPGQREKTEVSFFAAGSQDVRERLRPFIEAGFEVEGVTTPCGALWSQARLRRPSQPGEVHAHVALGISQSALGIFSNGSLLYARDVDWGYAMPPGGSVTPLSREELAKQLSLELRRSFLYLKQYWEEDVSQVVLCGDMPEIRSLTAPLIERLNIEVETLDTLEGIDTASLPEGFGDQAATYRLASSIAAEPPPVNLLPLEMTAGRPSRTAQLIVAAGAAAAVALAAFLYAQADVARTEAERQLTQAQRELSQVQSTIKAAAATAVPAEIEAVRRSARSTQGPSMARFLDVLATAAPSGFTVKSVRASSVPDENAWNVTIEAFAVGPDLLRARRASERFLLVLEESPLFGKPLQPSTLQLSNDSPRGIELAATYRVRQ